MNSTNGAGVLKTLIRYGLKVVAILSGILVLAWVLILLYVDLHEKDLVSRISSMIQQKTKGETKIGGLSVGLFRTFPIMSLQLEEVIIRDSLYPEHGLDLLNASDIYLRASLRGIITGRSPVGKVLVLNGTINLLTDTAGNTNEYIFNTGKSAENNKSFSIPDVVLKNTTVNYQNPSRGKSYKAYLRSFNCSPEVKNDRIEFRVNMTMQVNNIAFNTGKGAYLRKKQVAGKFNLVYEKKTNQIVFNKIRMNLDGEPFVFSGRFNTDKNNSDFNLNIAAKNMRYSKAVALLTPALEKKLNQYTVSKPVDFEVRIAGRTASKAAPLIEVFLNAKKADITAPFAEFDDCTFSASFRNEIEKGEKRTDENSGIHFRNFTAKWQGIGLKSDSITITNLIHPILECDIASEIEMDKLNSLVGSESIQFISGRSLLDVQYRGPILKKDTLVSEINGTIRIQKASMKYLPRNFMLSECEGTLKFVNSDLIVNKLSANSGKTRLNMKGDAKNFLTMLKKSPEQLVLNWNISTPKLHLEDFKSFLTKSKIKKKPRENAMFKDASSKVDRMFAEGDMNITLHADEMVYKTFSASDVKASVLLKPTEIAFKNVELKHANGSMEVSGSLVNGNQLNPVSLMVLLRDVNIPELFRAFRNFGQDAVTHENLMGKLSADIRFKTAINNNAELISDANEGYINFILQEGELNHFEPLQEISKKAFKKQDFTRVKFADLANRLDVKGTAFIINHMDIRSTALNLSVEGVYDIKRGTDMSIRLPFSNLTKSQENTDISDFGKNKKGLGLRLRAQTGDDGKLKISWDPFRRSIKNKSEVEDSIQAKK